MDPVPALQKKNNPQFTSYISTKSNRKGGYTGFVITYPAIHYFKKNTRMVPRELFIIWIILTGEVIVGLIKLFRKDESHELGEKIYCNCDQQPLQPTVGLELPLQIGNETDAGFKALREEIHGLKLEIRRMSEVRRTVGGGDVGGAITKIAINDTNLDIHAGTTDGENEVPIKLSIKDPVKLTNATVDQIENKAIKRNSNSIPSAVAQTPSPNPTPPSKENRNIADVQLANLQSASCMDLTEAYKTKKCSKTRGDRQKKQTGQGHN